MPEKLKQQLPEQPKPEKEEQLDLFNSSKKEEVGIGVRGVETPESERAGGKLLRRKGRVHKVKPSSGLVAHGWADDYYGNAGDSNLDKKWRS